jgi:hypothetical protein
MATRKFAAVAGEDVFTILIFDDDPEVNPSGPRHAAGFSSKPIIVEIEENSPVTLGWTYDGSTFTPPSDY